MANINLSAAVRSNLSSLQSTADLMSKTSDRLSTGNKVNSALDNPTNFFTASSLNSRAGDLNQLMDSMANGIKTIEAADNGLSSITKTLESMQSTLRQARQDKSFETASYTLGANIAAGADLSFSGGAIGETPVAIELTTTTNTAAAVSDSGTVGGLTRTSTLAAAGVTGTGTITVGDGTQTETFTVTDASTQTLGDLIDGINGEADLDVTASINDAGQFTLTADSNAVGITIGGTTTTGVTGIAAVAAPSANNVTATKTVDQLVSEINAKTLEDGSDNPLFGKIRASNDDGNLRIENLSTQELDIAGANSSGSITGVAANTAEILGNSVRSDLAEQFNELRDQLDKLADDASFNGINLLRGDNLKITFNETGTSSIDIQTKNGDSINAGNLKLETTLEAKNLDSDTDIDGFLDQVKTALNTVRSQSSAFGSNLSIVQNRQDFTKSMINTLETGAGNLTLADMNQEAANMMALQTRQSLASSTLSMANQADQGVLQLLR